jgi:membrane associated rhomboid family serine protease
MPELKNENEPDVNRFRPAFTKGFLFVAVLWLIRIIESAYKIDLTVYGIYPKTLQGFFGIFTAPLIHADFNHLFSNSITLLVLLTILFYFYKESALRVILIVYLYGGFLVWLAARPAYHIGASGLVYGLVCFLFFSGVFRWEKRAIILSLLITFLYGSLTWGILPIDETISFESHLFGAVTGMICAFIFRKYDRETFKEPEEATDEEEDPYEYIPSKEYLEMEKKVKDAEDDEDQEDEE